MAKRFLLIRDDHDSVNAPGAVAEGIMFQSGKVALNWIARPQSLQTFDSVADLMLIQERNQITRIQWLDLDDAMPRIQASGVQRLQRAQEQLSVILGQTSGVIREEAHSMVFAVRQH